MSLSTAKAKLDAQAGDPATGYISKQDHKDSYDELVADTALTGATTAAGITVSGAVQVGATAGLVVGASGPKVLSGSGSPEGAVTAPVGSIYLRTDGGADTAAYTKTSGTGNTGWTAVDTGTGDVVGPGSATDNAVARFDGTTGKLVQNSGVTADDSGNLTATGTVAGSGLAGSLLSSASPVSNGVAAAGSSAIPSRQDHVHPTDTTRAALAGATFTGDVAVSKASPAVIVDAADGNNRNFLFRTSGNNRWAFRANNVPESSTADGCDFLIASWNNSGVAAAYNHIYLWRNTGKTTFGSVGATAGLELGSSGPRMMSGTGSPEGAVTAPVGSIWFQSDSTVGVTHWRKESGTGNTGWGVMAGDTGTRNLTTYWTPSGITVNSLSIRRVNETIYLQMDVTLDSASGTNTIGTSWPAGFTPAGALTTAVDDLAVDTNGASTAILLFRSNLLGIYRSPAPSSGSRWRVFKTWRTTDAWPTSLPGSAA